ncbi:glycosyltransferase family 4 protein [Flavitalea flava]
MTIVYCIFSLAPPGGMQRALSVKATYLAEVAGFSIHVITRTQPVQSSGPAGRYSFNLSAKVKIHTIGKNYKKELATILYILRPDIVISLYGEESRFLYKIRDGSKKILEFHFTRNHLVHLVKGLPHLRFRKLRLQYVRLLQYLDERCARHYDCLVLLTEADRGLWGNPPNVVVIPNPLSFTSPVKSGLDSKRILSAGRLIATKGFDLLIEAYRLVAKRYPDWKLAIFGEGQDKQFLLNKIRNYGLENQVEIFPPTADIAGEMLRSSIYAAPSRYEGFGLVITEAMECGVPSVAFDCQCGPREIICDGSDGILVEPQNTEKFAEALLLLIASPELRTRMGKNAITSAARFAEDRIMDRWKNLFRSLVQDNRILHVR